MKILHLYPKLMNLYGDYGNITVLVKHLKDLGIKVELETKEVDELVNFKQYDFIYIGSGTEDNQLVALKDLFNYKNQIIEYINSDKLMLLTGNAMELLGQSINDVEALNLLDFNTEVKNARYTGDVIVRNDDFDEVVGFINKSSVIHGGNEYKLFDYIFKDNNLVDNDFEGYRYHNTFGTHIIGPVLVKNPKFLNYLVRFLAKEKYNELNYEFEIEAYNVTLRELKKRR